MPRDKEKGKPRGFAFLMYEDQRSTVLAVDNLNGAKVLEKTLRVDHVNNYKQKGKKNADGQWEEPEEQSLNARPEIIRDADDDDDDDMSSAPSIDPEDPMRDYLLAKRREEKGKSKSKKSKKREGETPEERRARKERKKAKREAKGKSGRDREEKDPSRSSRLVEVAGRVHERTRSRSPPARSHRDIDEMERRRREYGTR
ncbi:hypothetical protein FRB93_012406 [Tulasnella sp. JGI-2019a]|nr:hypothetical protein FRB93_012406 [Tulasnella sp. JGI-2019a]